MSCLSMNNIAPFTIKNEKNDCCRVLILLAEKAYPLATPTFGEKLLAQNTDRHQCSFDFSISIKQAIRNIIAQEYHLVVYINPELNNFKQLHNAIQDFPDKPFTKIPLVSIQGTEADIINQLHTVIMDLVCKAIKLIPKTHFLPQEILNFSELESLLTDEPESLAEFLTLMTNSFQEFSEELQQPILSYKQLRAILHRLSPIADMLQTGRIQKEIKSLGDLTTYPPDAQVILNVQPIIQELDLLIAYVNWLQKHYVQLQNPMPQSTKVVSTTNYQIK